MRIFAASVLPLVLVACPLVWSAVTSAFETAPDSGRIPLAELAVGWRGTLVWTVMIACTATVVGWIPGRALRQRVSAGGGAALATAIAWAALMPPYAIFYCGWRICRPGLWLADWAATHGHVGVLRTTWLALALVSWMWPVAALAVVALAPRRRSSPEELMRLDAHTRLDRVGMAWRNDWPALLVAALVMCIALVGETTAFDVARVVTASSELRLLDAAGATPPTLWAVASAPAAVTLLAALAAVSGWWALSRRRDLDSVEASAPGAHRSASPPGARAPGAVLAVLLCGAAVAAPVGLLAIDGISSGSWASFAVLHARAAAGSLASACVGGALGAAVGAVTCLTAFRTRSVAPVLLPGIMWAIGAATPGVLLATAYESMWNGVPALRPIYDSMLLVPMAQVAHAGLACWMLACLLAGRLSREAIDVETLHGRGMLDLLRAHGPCIAASGIISGMVMAAYCASETAIASRLVPPGAERIAPMLMNAIHYQDQSAALAALPWIGVMSAAMAGCAVLSWSWMSRTRRMGFGGMHSLALACSAALAISGAACERTAPDPRGAGAGTNGNDSPVQFDPLDRGGAGFGAMASDVAVSPDAPPPLACEQVIGMRGRMPGRLDYPRAADVAQDGSVAVIDKSGRVQRFAPDGSFVGGWRMPRTDNGMPTGVTIDRHGRVWIADTHEHRVLICSADGTELGSFGGYGRGAGEFVYPTDVLVLDDADPARCAVVVSEYGGNDRLQWFDVEIPGGAPAQARAVRSVGSQGSGIMQFLRPQSMARMPDGSIAVADACNHRIVLLSKDGQWQRSVGEPGRELGQLSYPYGVLASGSGDLLVAEFGNNRIQCLDAQGRGRWIRGGGGRETGRLVAPWSVAGDASAPVVVDAGNCRVVRVRLPGGDER
jgi:hypothetical protein